MNLSGNPLDYLLAFSAGIAVSFTPCVYPLIPICIGSIGASTTSSRLRAFFLSLIYVTGMSVTYSLLGLFASLTGELFGKVSNHPLTNIIVGVIIFIFGLYMLEVFHFILPNFVKVPVYKKKNYFSVFILGIVSGAVTGSCVTPALASILAYLATKKNIVYGMSLLFSFAFGMGLILILAGTFSGILSTLPKSGKWMVYIKKVLAVVLILAGIYFIFSGIRRF